VSGRLDLRGAALAHCLACEDCFFDSPVCLAEAAAKMVRLKGTQLPGLDAVRVRVDGMLDLHGAIVPGGVRLDFGKASGGVSLRGAVVGCGGDGIAISAEGLRAEGGMDCSAGFTAVGQVLLKGARIDGSVTMVAARISHPGEVALDADMATVAGELDGAGMDVEGESRIRGAVIAGPVSLTAATLRNPGGCALRATRLNAGGGLWCAGGFRAEGEVRLGGSRLGGSLRLNDATLSNPDGTALRADRATIGSLEGDGLTVSHGEIRLTGATISGNLSMSRAVLGRSPDGVSFVMDNAAVDGTLWLQRLHASGEIRVRNSRIGGRILLRGAELRNPGGCALRLTRNEVASDMVCTGLAATGEVRLVDSHFGRDVYMDQVTLANAGGVALDANGLRATEFTFLPAGPVQGTVTLENAQLGLLRDDPASWPAGLRLNGLRYDTLEPSLPARDRLAWLARTLDGYQPHPYEQLASVYARSGRLSESRRILHARERHHRSTMTLPGRIWSITQDATVGYGYRPGRATLWLAGLLTTGSVIFGIHPPRPFPGADAPHFNPVAYTLDLMLPITGLGQKGAFNPAGAEQWLSYFLIAAGWILATTIIAGLTRVLSRR
jgi:hypothetical protein